MAQVLIEYDERNSSAKKLLVDFLSQPFFKVKECDSPYDEEFLEMVEASFKGKRTVINVDDLWK